MVVGYQDSEIEEYEDFIEYKQEQRLQDIYKNIVTELEKSEVGKV